MTLLALIVLYCVLLAIGLFYSVYFPIRVISLWMSSHYGAPFVPLEQDIVERMIELAELKSGQKVYDLGSGDGRILFTAVEAAQVQVCGYEIAIYPYILCRIAIWKRRHRKEDITLLRRNFFCEDLSSADVIFLYQQPKVLMTLGQKFISELKPGTRVITARFDFKNWKPVAVDRSLKYPVYMYTVPAKAN